MELSGLRRVIRATPAYQRVLARLRTPDGQSPPDSITWELLEAARPSVLATLHADWPGNVLVLSPQPERARLLHEQAMLWANGASNGGMTPAPLWYFPAPDALFYDRTPWDGETVRRRVTVLSDLASRKHSQAMVFASVWAAMTLTAPAADLVRGVIHVRVGQSLRLTDLLDRLVQHAYEPASVVEEPGAFSRRGGILDIWPTNAEGPLRVEWSGDDIETIRGFDPLTQRSLKKVPSLTVYPGSEALPAFSGNALRCLPSTTHSTEPFGASRLDRDRESLEAGQYFRGIEFYLPALYEDPCTLLDYFPPDVLVVLDGLPAVDLAAQTLESQSVELRLELLEQGLVTSEFPMPYITWDRLGSRLSGLRSMALGYDVEDVSADAVASREFAPTFSLAPRYGGRINHLIEDCGRSMTDGLATVIVTRQAQRLAGWLEDAEVPARATDEVCETPQSGSVTVVHGALAEGWQLKDARPEASDRSERLQSGLVVLTDSEVFGWAKPRRRPYTRKKAASPEAFFADLRPGDHVVHIEHGIGVYRGLAQKAVEGAQREYLELEYAEGDRLFLPVSQIDRVTRYVGASDHAPSVHRLGSSDWAQVRVRAKRAVEDIAKDLLKLYAAREVLPGHSFAPDTAWQEELEASFPYEETSDQLRALAEVKEDMERPRPMDRLLVGDVGYGKTEVAVRAAFKAVMDGKQVAVLVPTTVLAQQHLLTFQERLAAFPVDVAMLSRFCSPEEQKGIADRLGQGAVDIVIGTHRLLQKDVTPKDLGLLIVDEEQRFGVKHKEWLKEMREQVDVLTMTATPIPRTLYMSLSGVRDMSTIDTPPEERLPIRTAASRFDEGLIRRALLREMSRNGQAYFVHNRVQGIRQIAQRLQKIVPEASIAIAHGQMDEEELSRVMLEFAAGRYHILVCTSIIESGLDIPNVNTIIINRADRFGLGQLYQLRGRVGRSTVQAYAYLLYDQRALSDVARRRLEAILEASELGAGYRIAMRDLEIRGAGEILGARQHGHVAAVGFELYCRLLGQAVAQLRATGIEDTPPLAEIELAPLIELPLEARLPEEYVADEQLRLRIYQRLADLATEEELDDVRRELEDRFGLLPEPVEDLLYVLRVRLLASRAGVEAVGREDGNLVLRLRPRALQPAREIASHFGRRAWLGRGQMWLALAPEATEWRTALLSLLVRLAHSVQREAESRRTCGTQS